MLAQLPTQCLICRSWQQHPLCVACLTSWRPPVLRCPRCAIALPHQDNADTCQQCEDRSPEFDRAIAALDYSAPWSPLLTKLKFNGATALARPLGDLLAHAVAGKRGRVSLLLPVPLSTQRLRERGYNQSWLLAQRVAARLHLRARHDLLDRTHHTTRLMTMSAQEREREINEAFKVTPEGQQILKGRHVAIVDDVMTTGATLNAATRALLEGGARSVSAWVVARTPSPDTACHSINAGCHEATVHG